MSINAIQLREKPAWPPQDDYPSVPLHPSLLSVLPFFSSMFNLVSVIPIMSRLLTSDL